MATLLCPRVTPALPLGASTAPEETPGLAELGSCWSWGLGGSAANLLPTAVRRSPTSLASSHCAHPGAGCAVGSGHYWSWGPPCPSLGWAGWGHGHGHSPPLCQHRSGPVPALQTCWPGCPSVPGKGLVARSQPGAVWGPPPAPLSPGPAGRGKPPMPSPVPAAVTQPVPPHRQPPGVIQVGGICFPRPFPSQPQPLAQPGSRGCPGFGVSAEPWRDPGQAPAQPRAGTERGGTPVPTKAEHPHTVLPPPQRFSGAVRVCERGHPLRLALVVPCVAPGAKPGILSGPRCREAAAGLRGGLLLPHHVPLPSMDKIPSCYPGMGLQGLLAPRCSRILSPASPRDAGLCPQHLPGTQDLDAGALTLAMSHPPVTSQVSR